MNVSVEYSELSSPPELVDHYIEATVIPFGDESLRHMMLVPRDWRYQTELENRLPSPAEFVTISLFAEHRDGGVQPFIDIGYTEMGCEVNILDLLEFYKDVYGMEILRFRRLILKGVEVVDCEVQTAEGPPCRTRMMLFVAGDRIFKVSGTAETAEYERYEETFEILTGSFSLTNHPGNIHAEPIEEHQVPAPIRLHFSYPTSWSLTVPEEAPEGRYVADLRLIGEDQLMGYIRVKGIDKAIHRTTDPNEFHDDALEEFSDAGFHIQEAMARWQMDTEGTDFLPENTAQSIAGQINDAQVEARVIVLETNTSYYVVSALLPAKDTNRLGWMRGKRALEIMLLTLNRSAH